jgi:hypothetical protein
VFHEPPSAEQLQAFADDPSQGPSLEDPHFDVKAGMLSEWNKTLLRLLQVDFQRRLPLLCANSGVTVPDMSNKYYTNLIAERFQRLAQVWKQGQAKSTRSGDVESPRDVEGRMATAREVTAKKQRHLSRRLYVRTGAVRNPTLR